MRADILEVKDLKQLVKDARRAIYAFIIINVIALLFFLLDGLYNEFVFMALFLQVFLFLFWLGPYFAYQVLIKKLRFKYAFYKSLASYKEALGHVSW